MTAKTLRVVALSGGWCGMPFFLLAMLVVLLALVMIIAVAYFVARRW
jgi:hypothetical protein